MRTVAGIFDNEITANRAVSSLLDEGFTMNDFSLILSDKAHSSLFPTAEDSGKRVTKGGMVGATVGGAIGALLAGLTTVGIIVLPGGSLLAVGPITAALYGAGAGGALGGLSGALISAGFATDEAQKFEREINDDKAVILVHVADDEREAAAKMVLSVSGAFVKAA